MAGLRTLLLSALHVSALHVPAAAEPYVLDDSNGLGMRWDGVGVISAGGASKLLMDYPQQAASDILDYMFKPNYGLSAQILKVEIGGDADSTEGAEPSFQHTASEAPNFHRGYEWWLMKAAKRRNPDIKLYGMPWAWPGWLDDDAVNDDKKASDNAFSAPTRNVNYTLSWLEGAKQIHGLDIDYVGQWNERDAPPAYAMALRKSIGESRTLGGKTEVVDRLRHYQGSTDRPDPQGCKQYSQENNATGSFWVDEEGSIFDGRSARCLARVVNRMYVSKCFTATFQWQLLSSFYDYLTFPRCGAAIATEPWSGAFEITSPTWALAHTTQFNPVGWLYAAHGAGVHMLAKGGSLVTRISPNKKDFSVVIEKMDSATSACARGDNPDSHPEPEEVVLQLKGAFLQAARGRGLQVWYSDLRSSSDFGANPPEAQLFQRWRKPLVPDDQGRVRLTVKPEELITLTTLTSGGKGTARSPPSAPFPTSYSQNFEDEREHAPPRFWYDRMGAWEVQRSPYGDDHGLVMRQTVPVWPVCWTNPCTGPVTHLGPAEFHGDLTLALDVRLEGESGFRITPQDSWKVLNYLHLDTNGSWLFGKRSGRLDFAVDAWHRVVLRIGKGFQIAEVDGHRLAKIEDWATPNPTACGSHNSLDVYKPCEKAPTNLAQGVAPKWTWRVSLNKYVLASIDNVQILDSEGAGFRKEYFHSFLAKALLAKTGGPAARSATPAAEPGGPPDLLHVRPPSAPVAAPLPESSPAAPWGTPVTDVNQLQK